MELLDLSPSSSDGHEKMFQILEKSGMEEKSSLSEEDPPSEPAAPLSPLRGWRRRF